MTGWLFFVLIGGAAMLGLWRAGALRRDTTLLALSAITLAAAGYAWQGRPGQPGAGAVATVEGAGLPPAMAALRGQMAGRFGTEAQWLILSDALLRQGDARTAIVAITSGIAHNPRSVLLWTALGSAYADHDGGAVSPAATFAFARAAGLNPRSPAPPFFRGLAHLRAGQTAEAERLWRRALALTPPNAPYRREVALRLLLLERIRAAGLRRGTPPPTRGGLS